MFKKLRERIISVKVSRKSFSHNSSGAFVKIMLRGRCVLCLQVYKLCKSKVVGSSLSLHPQSFSEKVHVQGIWAFSLAALIPQSEIGSLPCASKWWTKKISRVSPRHTPAGPRSSMNLSPSGTCTYTHSVTCRKKTDTKKITCE